MRWQPSSKRTPIGIDANGRFIHAVQLSRRSGGWRIDATASIPRPVAAATVDREAAERLAGVLVRQGFRGGDVVLAVPNQQLLFSQLNVPGPTPAAAIPQIARAQLATSHKCQPQALEVACWDLPAPVRAREGKWAQAVGCQTADANEAIDCFEAAGMIVRALDTESWAAARACESRLAGNSLSALLNLGWTGAHLVVLSGGTVIHERCLPDHGLRNLYAPFAEVFDLEPDVTEYIINEIGLNRPPPDQAESSAVLDAARQQIASWVDGLALEIERSLSYSAQEQGQAVSYPLLLHGDGASIPGATDRLSLVLGGAVETIAPVALTKCTASLSAACGSPSLITALGLAWHSGE